MNQSIYIIIVLGIVIIPLVLLDRWQAGKFRKINQEIAKNPDYLKDKAKWNLCRDMLQMTRPFGVFSIMQMNELKRSLDKYR